MPEVQEGLRHEQTRQTRKIRREMPALPECDRTSHPARARENGATRSPTATGGPNSSATSPRSGSCTGPGKAKRAQDQNDVPEVQEPLRHRQTRTAWEIHVEMPALPGSDTPQSGYPTGLSGAA